MTLGDLLIYLTVFNVNTQLDRAYDTRDFGILDIQHDYRYMCDPKEKTCVYEVYSYDIEDKIRIRLYCKRDEYTKMGELRQFTDVPIVPINEIDEIYAVDVRLDISIFFLANNEIRQSCPSLNDDLTLYPILLLEDGSPLLHEDGGYTLLELAMSV